MKFCPEGHWPDESLSTPLPCWGGSCTLGLSQVPSWNLPGPECAQACLPGAMTVTAPPGTVLYPHPQSFPWALGTHAAGGPRADQGTTEGTGL
jgi:hypothetical protein